MHRLVQMAKMSNCPLSDHVLALLDCPSGARGIVTSNLLNCMEVRSVALPTHPSAQDDVGTIAAKSQTANVQAEGFGEFGSDGDAVPFFIVLQRWRGAAGC